MSTPGMVLLDYSSTKHSLYSHLNIYLSQVYSNKGTLSLHLVAQVSFFIV